jgi:transcriptional regulator
LAVPVETASEIKMYVPKEFAAPNDEAAWAAVAAAPFGLLITASDGQPAVTHLPFLVAKGETGAWQLSAHLAVANPHAEAVRAGADVLCVFNGPHAYVSPTWYGGPGVPTWNYVAVHVRGRARTMDDAALAGLLRALSAVYEGDGPGAWTPAVMGEKALAGLRRAIVGFTVEVAGIEAKFKLSQNRPAADRARVVTRFQAAGTPDTAALAELMENL